jgi:hypothetical protein
VKAQWLFALGAVAGAAAMFLPHTVGLLLATTTASASAGEQANSLPPLRRTEEKFAFTAHASMEVVAPLFGAHRERDWALGWNPKFIYPSPAADARGMVFTVAHQHHDAVWVNTEFDLLNGRVQYVYVIPEALVTVITLKLSARESNTYVEVEYDRTALNREANPRVEAMASQDRVAGPEWEKEINDYLNNSRP